MFAAAGAAAGEIACDSALFGHRHSGFGWSLVGLRFYSTSEMDTERLSEKV